VAVAVLAALATKAPEDKAGWRRIAPSAMHWIAIVLGAALVLFMAYIRLFVGSTRSDAATQMTILTWLIVAFAMGTIVTAFSILAIQRRAVRWRGSRIVWFERGQEHQADLAELTGFGRTWLGYQEMRFADGTVLRIDRHARGARQLLETVQERWTE
jgi:hypothetical protein